jgi:hypothetical protein
MKPTKEAIEAMKEEVLIDLSVVRHHLAGIAEQEMASLETFVAIALRVMSTVNASKVKDAMVAVEIQARMDGRHVYE